MILFESNACLWALFTAFLNPFLKSLISCSVIDSSLSSMLNPKSFCCFFTSKAAIFICEDIDSFSIFSFCFSIRFYVVFSYIFIIKNLVKIQTVSLLFPSIVRAFSRLFHPFSIWFSRNSQRIPFHPR